MREPPDIEKALAELEEEMRGFKVRRSASTPRSLSPSGKVRVRWPKLYEWCVTHPGVGVTLEAVPANGPYRLRKRYPDLRVESEHHRREGGTGPRVADLFVIYEEAPDA